MIVKRTRGVTVRMYNVGLGDCFLLRFPDEGNGRTVLIDCGAHPSGPGPYRIEEVVQRIIGDVRDGNGGLARIDVVIATHRHRDHVSGFESRRWEEVEVGEVWMPWTEHPEEDEARAIRELQSRKARVIHLSMAAEGGRFDELQMVENSMANQKAMATLHSGFAGRPKRRFLPARDRADQTFTTDLLPGVTIHAMGPSRSAEVIRDMNPPEGAAYELRFAAMGAGEKISMNVFPEVFRLNDSARNDYLASFGIDPLELRDLELLSDESPFSLAVQLDRAINGTSLMLMFEMGKAHLLFPGDAQWGTWQNAMNDKTFRALLEKTSFLKVGHHGSHNATPIDFVNDILGKTPFAAMVCTRSTTRYPRIPLPSLLNALIERSGKRVVRSDESSALKGFWRHDDVSTETVVEV